MQDIFSSRPQRSLQRRLLRMLRYWAICLRYSPAWKLLRALKRNHQSSIACPPAPLLPVRPARKGEPDVAQNYDIIQSRNHSLLVPAPLKSVVPLVAPSRWQLPQQNQAQAAQRPFDWILENHLAIGPLPRRGWLPHLEQGNIKTIIALCGEAEGKLPKEFRGRFRCVRVLLPDRCNPQHRLTVEELSEAVALIHWNLKKRQPVYLHCLAGSDRAPLVAIAYLCRHHAMDLLDASGWLAHVHPSSRLQPAQLKLVLSYLKT